MANPGEQLDDQSLRAGDSQQVRGAHNPASDQAKADRDRTTARLLILAMLFFVTGFLGLPVLWISKSFSLTEKLIWSIVNTIYTCALIAGTIAICVWALRPLFSTLAFN
ncbi:hypothetical protein SH449x_002448 [Pirellulaceae bacterium SH449]